VAERNLHVDFSRYDQQ